MVLSKCFLENRPHPRCKKKIKESHKKVNEILEEEFFFSVKGMRQKDNKNNTNCKKNKKNSIEGESG